MACRHAPHGDPPGLLRHATKSVATGPMPAAYAATSATRSAQRPRVQSLSVSTLAPRTARPSAPTATAPTGKSDAGTTAASAAASASAAPAVSLWGAATRRSTGPASPGIAAPTQTARSGASRRHARPVASARKAVSDGVNGRVWAAATGACPATLPSAHAPTSAGIVVGKALTSRRGAATVRPSARRSAAPARAPEKGTTERSAASAARSRSAARSKSRPGAVSSVGVEPFNRGSLRGRRRGGRVYAAVLNTAGVRPVRVQIPSPALDTG